MKFSKSTSAFILANALTANAFTSTTPSYTQQQRVSSTQHNLVVDANIIGQLALALPVGLGLVSQTNKPTNKDINTLARENIDVLSSEYVYLSKEILLKRKFVLCSTCGIVLWRLVTVPLLQIVIQR